MSIENDNTVEVYKVKARTYLKTSLDHDNRDLIRAKQKREELNNFIKTNIEKFPTDSKIFEIGSGDGSNAEYMKKLGYSVLASDVADDFIDEIKSKGLHAVKFNVLKDNFKEKYDIIFCWRVFVHFTNEDAEAVIKKTFDSLKKNGIFIFNAINREIKNIDDEWVDFNNEYHMGAERYYKYFRSEELEKIINKSGFKILDFHKEGGELKNKWLIYVLKK